MADKLLEIKDLHASVEDKEILKGLDLSIDKGEVHVILGPNGSGKSTLMNIIMGHPKYDVTAGSMYFEGKDLQDMKTFERARAGIFLSFQTPEENPLQLIQHFFNQKRIVLPVSRTLFCGEDQLPTIKTIRMIIQRSK